MPDFLTELDPDEADRAGAKAALSSATSAGGRSKVSGGLLGLAVERDRHFPADKPLSVYVEDASRCPWRIVA